MIYATVSSQLFSLIFYEYLNGWYSNWAIWPIICGLLHLVFSTVEGEKQHLLVAFLLRCFLVGMVEPGRKVLTKSVWELAESGGDFERLLESKFIRVEDLPTCQIFHVSLAPDLCILLQSWLPPPLRYASQNMQLGLQLSLISISYN